jgi:predicted transcriptional regulator
MTVLRGRLVHTVSVRGGGGFVDMTDKQRVLEAVQRLPEDATVEDAIERLCFIAKVQQGLGELDAGQSTTHEEAKRRILRD